MTNTHKARVALIQMCSGQNVQENIYQTCQFVTEAAKAGAEYILTPENTSLMELRTKALFAAIETEDNNSVLSAFSDLAKRLSIWLHIGSIPVKLSEEKVANRSYVISPKGDIVTNYDKIHMFDVDLPGGEKYRESKNYVAGQVPKCVDLPWGKLGLTICYDLRFPYLYRMLAHAGAHMISVPSAFTQQTGKAHWEILLRARAIETGCFIFAAAQGGRHENGRETYGNTMIVSPWGEIIANMGRDPGWICAHIDLQEVSQAREKIPSLQHDRRI
ncbi:MAG: carbon-nitrogen hydrolase family protein [Pseudomonadota bacterium]